MDFVLSKRGQELIRGMSRIPDRIDTRPEQARLIEGIQPAFAPRRFWIILNAMRNCSMKMFSSGRRAGGSRDSGDWKDNVYIAENLTELRRKQKTHKSHL